MVRMEGISYSFPGRCSCTCVLIVEEKASKLAKEYEKQGGEYENEAGSKNEPKKGDPQPKSESKKKKETQEEEDE
jgi:hypothetical protein